MQKLDCEKEDELEINQALYDDLLMFYRQRKLLRTFAETAVFDIQYVA